MQEYLADMHEQSRKTHIGYFKVLSGVHVFKSSGDQLDHKKYHPISPIVWMAYRQ